jgi:cellulose biosynthesis protein BcsQ
MQILLLESSAPTRAMLRGRIIEGLRQAEIRGLELTECPLEALAQQQWATICGVVIGPSFHATSEGVVERIRTHLGSGPLAFVLEEDAYALQAASMARKLDLQVHSMGELTGLVSFLIECEKQHTRIASLKNRGILGIAQLKGGVGTTTVAASLAGCWARHGTKSVLIDLDDVTPALTAWARVGMAKRTAVSEHLALGQVPESRLPDLAARIDGFNNNLAVIGQPESYNEGFHFKANVIDSAPSAAEFMHSLISALKSEFEAVVLDLSRSWGLATFASLQRCERVILVVDEDKQSMLRSIDSLRRMKKESDDPEEFDLSRWTVLVNAYTGDRVPLQEARALFEESEIFGASPPLVAVPYSSAGPTWAESDRTLFDLAEPVYQEAIKQIAYNLLPFRLDSSSGLQRSGLLQKLKKLTGAG